MVETELPLQKLEVGQSEGGYSEHPVSVFRRDPSFSGWFDEDGAFHSPQLGDVNIGGGAEDSDFELPHLHHSESEIGDGSLEAERQQLRGTFWERMRGGFDLGEVSARHGKESYVPFDVENGSKDGRSSDSSVGERFVNYHDTSRPFSRSPISVTDVLKTLFFILVWYIFSTILTMYNKTLLGDHLGKFPAPLLMNTVHFTMQAILANTITWIWSERFKPTIPMSWKDYFLRVVPTALGTALDVNLSNESLVFITVTFATMCKSAAPIFLLFFAFAFRLESPSFKLFGIILIISVGILLTVAKETEFQFWGFILVMLAAFMSGFRWTMTQILLQKETYGLKNPLTLMSYVTPVMALSTALLSLFLDPWNEFSKSHHFNSSWHITRSCLLMLFGGTLAFFMVLTEFILVSVTSAVTVTIAGVVKEAVTILVAVFYFHDEFTWLKGLGLGTIMVGVSLFNWYKYKKLQKGQSSEDEIGGSVTKDATTKYVILEEMEDQEDDGP
nr:probable sugar phosphate/phosphate translocator At1g06470 [Ipomoea batatas]GMC72704.1 probable sugar phosphate/phosphate translocator At1g06470 [Ipomoea batatas]GMC76795.1 probable sugar phosphate/phosphate translocator At1g06470 [Ipomoea batatas]GME13017.1 probable sugar phosphate/phosphate translocator At1g06470 [Ipomoea batatas]